MSQLSEVVQLRMGRKVSRAVVVSGEAVVVAERIGGGIALAGTAVTASAEVHCSTVVVVADGVRLLEKAVAPVAGIEVPEGEQVGSISTREALNIHSPAIVVRPDFCRGSFVVDVVAEVFVDELVGPGLAVCRFDIRD